MATIVLVTTTPNPDGAEDLATYQKLAMPVVARHGGEVVYRGRRVDSVAGSGSFAMSLAIRFPDEAAARAWHADPDYQAAIAHRNKAFTAFEAHLINE